MIQSRKDKLDQLFRKAEEVILRLYPDKKINVDELTALTVAHLSNYLPEVMPEARPLIARLISLILDLETQLDGILSFPSKRNIPPDVPANTEGDKRDS